MTASPGLNGLLAEHGVKPVAIGHARDRKPVHGSTRQPRPVAFVPDAEFMAGDYSPTWLAVGAMVRGEPCVIAGPSKALKSSSAVDLAYSLAAGRPFLGHFRVPEPVRVVMASAESGRATLQAAAKRVRSARGITAEDVADRMAWKFDVPNLSDPNSVDDWAWGLAEVEADVFILDPFYLSLGAVDAKNLFDVGGCLRRVSEQLAAEGRTLVIVHHAGRAMPVGPPMELTHLAYSGLEQYARQFLLLNRRTAYRSDGRHELVLRAGGSAFSGGLFDLDIDEGTTAADFTGRHWNVTVTPAGSDASPAADREELKREAVRREIVSGQTLVLNAVDTLGEAEKAASVEAIRLKAGIRVAKAQAAIRSLLEDGLLEHYEAPPKGSRKIATIAYRRPSKATATGLFEG